MERTENELPKLACLCRNMSPIKPCRVLVQDFSKIWLHLVKHDTWNTFQQLVVDLKVSEGQIGPVFESFGMSLSSLHDSSSSLLSSPSSSLNSAPGLSSCMYMHGLLLSVCKAISLARTSLQNQWSMMSHWWDHYRGNIVNPVSIKSEFCDTSSAANQCQQK